MKHLLVAKLALGIFNSDKAGAHHRPSLKIHEAFN
jgi:hypothetical protein